MGTNSSIALSVIIPVFNEAESLPELYRELNESLKDIAGEHEIIFIDDGSTDGSFEQIENFAVNDSRVRVLAFRRNYGKSAAYAAGFKAGRGEILLTLDSDLQDVPAEIPKLLGVLNSGHDMVVGWKQGRLENEPSKKIPSVIFNGLKKLLFGIGLHDSNSGFRAMRKEVANRLRVYGDRYRFLPELAHLRGYRVTEVPVAHRKRTYGRSKYGVYRFVTGLLDLLSVRYLASFAERPLHFFGSLALIPLLVGGGLEMYVLVQKLSGSLFRTHIAALVIGVMLIVVGVQLLAIGLIGEMLSFQRRGVSYSLRRPQGEQTADHNAGEKQLP